MDNPDDVLKLFGPPFISVVFIEVIGMKDKEKEKAGVGQERNVTVW